jgi:hypothetical protein
MASRTARRAIFLGDSMADLYLPAAAPVHRLQAMKPPTAIEPDRWRLIAAAFADTGGLVVGDELADLIRQQTLDNDEPLVSQPVSLVARWIVSGMALSMESPWGIVLPMFQFDLPRAALHPGVPMVCAELAGALDSTEMALWFVTPNEWLQGERPARAIRSRLSDVRRAARHVADGG